MQVDYIVVHCSATRAHQDIGATDIDQWHRARGWRKIGYHFVIRRNGTREYGRSLNERGAHVAGYNHCSVGVCMAGGLNKEGKPEDNFTEDQKAELALLLAELSLIYPKAKIVGHRDLSPDINKDGKVTPNEWLKDCPCFDVRDFCDQVGINHNGG